MGKLKMVLGESEHKQGKKPGLGRGGARYGLGLFFSSSCVLSALRLLMKST